MSVSGDHGDGVEVREHSQKQTITMTNSETITDTSVNSLQRDEEKMKTLSSESAPSLRLQEQSDIPITEQSPPSLSSQSQTQTQSPKQILKQSLTQLQTSKEDMNMANAEVTASMEIIRKVREQTNIKPFSASTSASTSASRETSSAVSISNAVADVISRRNAQRSVVQLQQLQSESQSQNDRQLRLTGNDNASQIHAQINTNDNSNRNHGNSATTRQRSLPLRLSTSHADTLVTKAPTTAFTTPSPRVQIQSAHSNSNNVNIDDANANSAAVAAATAVDTINKVTANGTNIATLPIRVRTNTPKSKVINNKANIKPITNVNTNVSVNVNLPTTMSLTTPWARKFILSRPKDALLPIPREYLSDGFNLVQLAPVVERAVAAIVVPLLAGGSEAGSASGSASGIVSGNGSDSGKEDAANGRTEATVGGSTITATTTAGATTAVLSNVSLYKAALKLILETEEEGSSATSSSTSLPSIAHANSKYTPFQIQKAAEVLYTLVHARYVTSPRGLETIRRMFKRNVLVSGGIEPIFGRCSRLACGGMPLLPIGMSDRYDIGGRGGAGRKAMRCCPSCRESFFMWDSKIDGAAWGTSFCHLFLMAQGSEVFGDWLRKGQGASRGNGQGRRSFAVAGNVDQSRPKVFGFPIHPAADMYNM